VVATALLSPLLGTLTETVSSDSIIACACLLQLAHLFLHDYHFSAALTAHLSGSLALGAAVCGSVLIASRLGSPAAVYAQVCCRCFGQGTCGVRCRPCRHLLRKLATCKTPHALSALGLTAFWPILRVGLGLHEVSSP
jgi:hypothetical protein